MADTYSLIQEARKTNPCLNILGVLLTRYNPRLNVSKAMIEAIDHYAAKIGTHVFKTTIRESVAMRVSRVTKEDPVKASPKAPAVLDYIQLTDEVLTEISKTI